MTYAVIDFNSDLRAITELGPEEWTLREEELPRFEMGEKVYRVNLNNPLGYVLQHFKAKYGKNAADYSFRFVKVCQFLFDHRTKLLKAKGKIVLPAEPGDPPVTFQVNQHFLEFLLGEFQVPQPPIIFPTHPLLSKRGNEEFPYRRTLQAFRKWQGRRSNI